MEYVRKGADHVQTNLNHISGTILKKKSKIWGPRRLGTPTTVILEFELMIYVEKNSNLKASIQQIISKYVFEFLIII